MGKVSVRGQSFKYTASTSDAQDMQKVEKELGFRSKNRFIPKDLRMHNEIEKLFPVKGNDIVLTQPPPPIT